MTTNFRKSIIWAVVLLALTCTSGLMAQSLPTLSINPIAVSVPPDTNQFLQARFSDGSLPLSCTWKSSGAGENGTKLDDNGRNWAVFFTGTQAGVIYTISAECKNAKGIAGHANAYVFVQ